MTLTEPAVRENSIRVLVADDYPPFADLVAGRLRDDGYKVEVVRDGGACLHAAVNFRPHALIADVLMKGIGGFELADIFAARFPGCRVLLISADPYVLSDSGPFEVAAKTDLHDTLFDFLAGCAADD